MQDKTVAPRPTLADLGARLCDLLKLRTLPIGLKLFEGAEQAASIAGLRRPPPGQVFTTCQLVTQARIAGITLGIFRENLPPGGNCAAVVGLGELSDEYTSGRRMQGVWFENLTAAGAHQAGMPRVPCGRYEALVASPLRSGRLEAPDTVLFYANPAQMILFINGLQWKNYRRFDFSITGESACADSWGRALASCEPSLSIPCYAERRYGGVTDDELLMAVPPHELEAAVAGLEGLSRAGLRYPILPYGASVDPSQGMARSYAASSA